jgi:uncharacterized protein
MQLTQEELRVLGCLVEKQMTTPDVYPMSLNGLVTACNQTTNREPVVTYSERTALDALDGLRTTHRLVRVIHAGAGSRVDKYRHVLDERLAVTPKEAALLAVLALRGPQTVGELKSRTERYVDFASLDEVDAVLTRLCDPTIAPDPSESAARTDAGMLSSASTAMPVSDERPDGYARPWPAPLVVRFERLPGQKEPRVATTLGGPIDPAAFAAATTSASSAGSLSGAPGWRERCDELAAQLRETQAELAALRAEFDTFRSQF